MFNFLCMTWVATVSFKLPDIMVGLIGDESWLNASLSFDSFEHDFLK